MRVIKWEKEERAFRKQGIADTTYSSAIINGERYFQIQTYGSSEREVKGSVSQTIQFNRVLASELVEILKREFDL